jgi:hypothetical protein
VSAVSDRLAASETKVLAAIQSGSDLKVSVSENALRIDADIASIKGTCVPGRILSPPAPPDLFYVSCSLNPQ